MRSFRIEVEVGGVSEDPEHYGLLTVIRLLMLAPCFLVESLLSSLYVSHIS